MKLPWKISEDEDGLRVWFRVPGYPNAKSVRFRRGTPKKDIEKKVRERIEELKLRARVEGESLTGGFAADVDRYLKLAKVRRLTTFAERKMHLEKFAARFGNRDRLSITKQEVEVAMGEWQEEENWTAGTFNRYLTALKHFYNSLDDPQGRLANPVRKIARQPEPEPLPRGIDYETIHRIFDAMGREDSVSPETDAEIRRLFHQGLTRRQIAQQVGFSSDTVGKVLKREPARPGDDESLAEIRLRVIAFTGLRNGQVGKLLPEHYDRANKRVWVTGTKKTNSFWKPLDEEGMAALDRLAAANAWGPFANKPLHRAWKTALKRLGLPDTLRVYDLRHSYLTAAYLATGDLGAVQAIGGHRQLKTVQRYTKAAVAPLAAKTLEALSPLLRRKTPLSPETVTGMKARTLHLAVNS